MQGTKKILFTASLVLLFVRLGAQYPDLETSKPSAKSLKTIRPQSWTSLLPDSLSIAQMTIPGTHDAGALYDFWLFKGTTKTQSLSIEEQLNIGVRFLDIRCNYKDGDFKIYHGIVNQKQDFDSVLKTCYQFLEQHPRETLIISVQQEESKASPEGFLSKFKTFVDKAPSKWHQKSGIPLLGEARGKLVLINRFSNTFSWGINASQDWVGTSSCRFSTKERLVVQALYEVDDLDQKWNCVQSLLKEAKSNNSRYVYLNFASGYSLRKAAFGLKIPDITAVSEAIMPKLSDFFKNSGKARYGVVAVDFITPEISKFIYETNFD